MKLVAREDIHAPIDAVFTQLADFEGFERAVLRRGAEVVRTDELGVTGPGMAWRAGFDFRGRTREANIQLVDFTPSDRMRLDIHSAGLALELAIDLLEMSRQRTRVTFALDARPRTIPARLMIQSAKLARQNVLKRYRTRINAFAADIESRAKAAQG